MSNAEYAMLLDHVLMIKKDFKMMHTENSLFLFVICCVMCYVHLIH